MIRINVRARPGAPSERVRWLADGRLEVAVRAPARDGRANEALVAFLAASLALKRQQVRLVRGERARDKIVEIEVENEEELRRRLEVGRRGKP